MQGPIKEQCNGPKILRSPINNKRKATGHVNAWNVKLILFFFGKTLQKYSLLVHIIVFSDSSYYVVTKHLFLK